MHLGPEFFRFLSEPIFPEASATSPDDKCEAVYFCAYESFEAEEPYATKSVAH